MWTRFSGNKRIYNNEKAIFCAVRARVVQPVETVDSCSCSQLGAAVKQRLVYCSLFKHVLLDIGSASK
jgi:hypothetical protein